MSEKAHEFFGSETAGDEVEVEEVERANPEAETEIPDGLLPGAGKRWSKDDIAYLVNAYPLDGDPPRDDKPLEERLGRPISAIYSKWRGLVVESRENEEAATVAPEGIADAVGKVLAENVDLKKRLTVTHSLLNKALLVLEGVEVDEQ